MPPNDRRGDDHDDDDHAFAEAMRGARPLPAGHAHVVAPPAAPSRRKPPAAAASVSPFVVEQTGETIAGRASDVAVKLLHELRGGTHALDARIDLHGRARAQALRDLERFVIAARARGERAARDPRPRARVRRGRPDPAPRRLGMAGEPGRRALRRHGVHVGAPARRWRRRDAGAAAAPRAPLTRWRTGCASPAGTASAVLA